MENISKNITYAEAIHSQTAKRRGIDNTPNPAQLENMKLVAEKIFEPLRSWVGGPIKVNSFFRSPELNTAIGGVASSQHCKGQAIDIDDVYGRRSNAEMFTYIREMLDFDQDDMALSQSVKERVQQVLDDQEDDEEDLVDPNKKHSAIQGIDY